MASCPASYTLKTYIPRRRSYLLTAFSQICGVDFKHTVVIFLCLCELKHLNFFFCFLVSFTTNLLSGVTTLFIFASKKLS